MTWHWHLVWIPFELWVLHFQPNSLQIHLGKQQKMIGMFGTTLPPICETEMELQDATVSMIQFWMLESTGLNQWMEDFFYVFFLCVLKLNNSYPRYKLLFKLYPLSLIYSVEWWSSYFLLLRILVSGKWSLWILSGIKLCNCMSL